MPPAQNFEKKITIQNKEENIPKIIFKNTVDLRYNVVIGGGGVLAGVRYNRVNRYSRKYTMGYIHRHYMQ
jgi:hypothetical protein